MGNAEWIWGPVYFGVEFLLRGRVRFLGWTRRDYKRRGW